MKMDSEQSSRRGAAATIRRLAVDAPGSAGAKARAGRWRKIQALFPQMTKMSVLDLGGTVESWQRAPIRPAHVTVVNLFEPGESAESWLTPVTGDACAARAVLDAVGSRAGFDLVFSNSLIEHVGGHSKRADLANEIRALAPYHWVQTPYRYFPVEPHWLFPGMQFLPMRGRVTVAERWPLAHSRPKSREDAMSEVMWTELVGITELRALFPESQVVHEKIAGVTKSVSAVRAPGG